MSPGLSSSKLAGFERKMKGSHCAPGGFARMGNWGSLALQKHMEQTEICRHEHTVTKTIPNGKHSLIVVRACSFTKLNVLRNINLSQN